MARSKRLPLVIAIACALFVRAMLPAGWMPAEHGAAFAFELCPAAGPTAVKAAHHHGGKHGSHGDQHSGDCAFAPLMAGLALADLPARLPDPVATPRLFTAPAGRWSLPTGPPAPPPPATGPPAFA